MFCVSSVQVANVWSLFWLPISHLWLEMWFATHRCENGFHIYGNTKALLQRQRCVFSSGQAVWGGVAFHFLLCDLIGCSGVGVTWRPCRWSVLRGLTLVGNWKQRVAPPPLSLLVHEARTSRSGNHGDVAARRVCQCALLWRMPEHSSPPNAGSDIKTACVCQRDPDFKNKDDGYWLRGKLSCEAGGAADRFGGVQEEILQHALSFYALSI